MSKYFKNVKSFEDLKKQFRDLLKANHPDNGGDAEKMKEINVEYDALFPIWKKRTEQATGEIINETADSTRKQFYTMNGWEGSNHDWNRSLKEVAQIVRAYVKEKYPTYKFSVRTSYASMCQELHVEMKESPVEIYKRFEDLTPQDFLEISKRIYRWSNENRMKFLDATNEEKRKIIEESRDSYKNLLNEVTESVVKDVDEFVNSYNYHDCDGMIDYFDVDFYYFGCLKNNGRDIKIVSKTARIKNKTAKPAKEGKQTAKKVEGLEKSDKKCGYTYKITKGEDTRDGSELWIVRIVETLDKSAYIAENKAMKERGGYYSKFLSGFVFRYDPTSLLKGA